VEARRNDDFSYTPAQAALILRVSPTRVRQLLQDGELEGKHDEAGHWLIPTRAVHERLERLRRESFLEAVGYDPLSVREMRGLVEDLREQVRYLRSILSEEREARRRADTIIAQLTEANIALAQGGSEMVAPQEPPEAPESVVEEPPERAPRPVSGGPQNSAERPLDTAEFPVPGSLTRPWWRRVLGR
jgi:hypothetical protein